eukprot:937446_1
MPINYDDHGKSQLKVFIKARNKKNPTAKIRLTGKVGELRDRLKEDDIRRAKAKREETAAKKKANKKKRNKKNTVIAKRKRKKKKVFVPPPAIGQNSLLSDPEKKYLATEKEYQHKVGCGYMNGAFKTAVVDHIKAFEQAGSTPVNMSLFTKYCDLFGLKEDIEYLAKLNRESD